jgi:hypothetical protein
MTYITAAAVAVVNVSRFYPVLAGHIGYQESPLEVLLLAQTFAKAILQAGSIMDTITSIIALMAASAMLAANYSIKKIIPIFVTLLQQSVKSCIIIGILSGIIPTSVSESPASGKPGLPYMMC